MSDGWREHAQENWPQATATIERCSLDPYVPLESASRTPVWHNGCRIGYRANASQIESKIHSRSASGWGGHTELMGQWVTNHPSGSTIVVRYNPTDLRPQCLPRRICPTRDHEPPTTSGSF